jgi:fructose-1,6-bisphosphatase
MLESVAHPSRLQLIYEILPVAFLIEKAGGKTSDGEQSVLDIPITGYKQKSSFVAGSVNDVEHIVMKVKTEEDQEHKKMRELGVSA